MKKLFAIMLLCASSFSAMATQAGYNFPYVLGYGSLNQDGGKVLWLPDDGPKCFAFFHLIDTTMECAQVGTGLTVSGSMTVGSPPYRILVDTTVIPTITAMNSALAGKLSNPTGTTAQYLRGDGTLATFPSIPSVSAFNFSQPTARTLAVSTSYQALDNTKAAVIIPSYACQNATQVLASSACTIQVRMGTGTLTCSTGTVYYTQRLAVSLGVLLTQDSTNPVQINLPIGASFIMCPQAGTFTISAVEQSAG